MSHKSHEDALREHYSAFRARFSAFEQAAEQVGHIEETLASGREFTVRVTDKTLMPYIQPGDLMIFNSSNYDKIRTGDFVLYRLSSGAPAIRRVIHKGVIDGSAGFVTRSDINHEERDQLKASQVMARLCFVERHGKRIKGSSLNRGVLDWLSAFGSRSIFHRLVDFLVAFLPMSKRPDRNIKATKVERPVTEKKKATEPRPQRQPTRPKSSP